LANNYLYQNSAKNKVMRNRIIICFLLLHFLTITHYMEAQNPPADDKIFQSYSTIFNPTTRKPPEKSFNLNIQHRFGKMNLTDSLLFKNFFGMDLSSDLRFSFQVPVSRWLVLGIGRTKSMKQYDFETKIALLSQSKLKKIPFSVTYFNSFTLMSDDFPEIEEPENNFYSDSLTPFAYKFTHRLSYVHQLIVAKKITNWLSVQLSPTIIYRNLVPIEDKNFRYSLPAAFYFKTGFRSGILLEYCYLFEKPEKYTDLWGIAYEIKATNHTFQITLTNTQRISLNRLYTTEAFGFSVKSMFLGFNIHRNFYFKKSVK